MANYSYGNITLNPQSTYSVSTGTSASWPSGSLYSSMGGASPTVIINNDGIKLTGESDMVIGGRSIRQILNGIEARLAMLEPNIKLESEWEELKRLGDEYRALEQEIQEKMKTWDILKK